MSSSLENVFIAYSPHVLLIYFLVNNLQKLQNTAYFFLRTRAYSEEEKRHAREIFPHSYFFHEYTVKHMFKKPLLLRWFSTALQLFVKVTLPYIVMRATKNFRWPFVKTAEIFCDDDPTTAKALIGRRDYTYLEEGLVVYEADTLLKEGHTYLARFASFLRAPFGVKGLGLTSQAKKIILTGLADIPNCYKDKNVEIISMSELWEKSSPEKKATIMKFFYLTFDDIEAIRQKDIVFVEQPLEKNAYITMEEKIEMMRRIFDRYDHSRILLKTHYRTTIDYRKVFPDILVWDKRTPMELLNFCGAKFTEAVTVTSTSVQSFPKDVHIVWLGSNPEDPCFAHINPKSRKKFNEFLHKTLLPTRVKEQDNKKEGSL